MLSVPVDTDDVCSVAESEGHSGPYASRLATPLQPRPNQDYTLAFMQQMLKTQAELYELKTQEQVRSLVHELKACREEIDQLKNEMNGGSHQKLVACSSVFPELQKLQINEQEFSRIVPLPQDIHPKTTSLLIDITSNINANGASHLYGKFHVCQTGKEGKEGWTHVVYLKHFRIYANNFHHSLEIPWDHESSLQTLSVRMDQTLQDWKEDSFSVTLVGYRHMS